MQKQQFRSRQIKWIKPAVLQRNFVKYEPSKEKNNKVGFGSLLFQQLLKSQSCRASNLHFAAVRVTHFPEDRQHGRIIKIGIGTDAVNILILNEHFYPSQQLCSKT